MFKKDKKIIIISMIIIGLMLVIRIFSAPLVAGDEFLNYYNNLKIFNGEKMWEDVNIITTPLIYLLGNVFFKIFGTNFIIYKIYNLIINIIFFFLLYKTFRNLKINKLSSLIYTFILEIQVISHVVLWGATYNIIAIMFCLIGLNLNIKRDKLKRYNFWQGLIIFLVFFTKHNIGLYYIISQIIIEMLVAEKYKKITNLLKQFLVFFTGVVTFGAILYYNNLVESFIDNAIKRINFF